LLVIIGLAARPDGCQQRDFKGRLGVRGLGRRGARVDQEPAWARSMLAAADWRRLLMARELLGRREFKSRSRFGQKTIGQNNTRPVKTSSKINL
jgi:hypothetical protein